MSDLEGSIEAVALAAFKSATDRVALAVESLGKLGQQLLDAAAAVQSTLKLRTHMLASGEITPDTYERSVGKLTNALILIGERGQNAAVAEAVRLRSEIIDDAIGVLVAVGKVAIDLGSQALVAAMNDWS